MRILTLGLAALVAATAPVATASAKQKTQWVHDGRAYSSYEACKRAKDKSRDRAAVVGAVGSGAVAAIAGGSVAETALVAGAGALTGAVIGKNAKKC